MLWIVISVSLQLVTLYPKLAATVETVRADSTPRQNVQIIYYDDRFLFAAGNYYGSTSAPGGSTVPGLFVHSKSENQWRRIVAISTSGGRFGSSRPTNPAEALKLSASMVGWDFTMFATFGPVPEPLRSSSSIVFPDRIRYDPATDRYELAP